MSYVLAIGVGLAIGWLPVAPYLQRVFGMPLSLHDANWFGALWKSKNQWIAMAYAAICWLKPALAYIGFDLFNNQPHMAELAGFIALLPIFAAAKIGMGTPSLIAGFYGYLFVINPFFGIVSGAMFALIVKFGKNLRVALLTCVTTAPYFVLIQDIGSLNAVWVTCAACLVLFNKRDALYEQPNRRKRK